MVWLAGACGRMREKCLGLVADTLYEEAVVRLVLVWTALGLHFLAYSKALLGHFLCRFLRILDLLRGEIRVLLVGGRYG